MIVQTKVAAPTLKGITFSRNIWKPFTPGAMLTLQRKNKKCQVSQANQSFATGAQADKLSIQSMDFAVSIIELVKFLKEKRESIISNQIGRSGTSIGANINEANYG